MKSGISLRKVYKKPRETLLSRINDQRLYNSCFYSSFLFFSNVASGWYFEEVIYTWVFSFLSFASIFYHSTYIRLSYLADQVACASSIAYTFYLWTLCLPLVKDIIDLSMACGYIFSLSYVIFSYYYGSRIRMFSHHPDKTIGNYWHSVLHFFACLGCHLVLLLKQSV